MRRVGSRSNEKAFKNKMKSYKFVPYALVEVVDRIVDGSIVPN